MTVFRRIVLTAALAGTIAGLFVTALHAITTVPLILRAETYEDAAHAGAPSIHGVLPAPHQGEHTPWKPRNGLERTVFTGLADVLTGIAFALLLTSLFALRGTPVGWRRGLFWGLAGFAVFSLAPGLGLPPELPGTAAAPLTQRQVWWVAAALAAAVGLALVVFVRRASFVIGGLALAALPHLLGAPHPRVQDQLVPDALAHQFVVSVWATNFFFWLALGSLSGLVYERLGEAPSGLGAATDAAR